MRKVLYIFGELADRDIDWLIANGEKEEWEDGSVLIRKGSPITKIYINLRGSLSVFRDDAQRNKIAELGVGEFVGEMSFVDSSPTSATVTAEGPVTVYSIARDRLVAHVREDDGFGARFYHAIGGGAGFVGRARSRHRGHGFPGRGAVPAHAAHHARAPNEPFGAELKILRLGF